MRDIKKTRKFKKHKKWVTLATAITVTATVGLMESSVVKADTLTSNAKLEHENGQNNVSSDSISSKSITTTAGLQTNRPSTSTIKATAENKNDQNYEKQITIQRFSTPTGQDSDGNFIGMQIINDQDPKSKLPGNLGLGIGVKKDGSLNYNIYSTSQEQTLPKTEAKNVPVPQPKGYVYDKKFTKISDPHRSLALKDNNGELFFDTTNPVVGTNAYQVFYKKEGQTTYIPKAKNKNSYEGAFMWFDNDNGYYLGSTLVDDYSKGLDENTKYKIYAPKGYRFILSAPNEFANDTEYNNVNVSHPYIDLNGSEDRLHVGFYNAYEWAHSGVFDVPTKGTNPYNNYNNGKDLHFFRCYVQSENPNSQTAPAPTKFLSQRAVPVSGSTDPNKREIFIRFFDDDNSHQVGQVRKLIGNVGTTILNNVNIPEGYIPFNDVQAAKLEHSFNLNGDSKLITVELKHLIQIWARPVATRTINIVDPISGVKRSINQNSYYQTLPTIDLSQKGDAEYTYQGMSIGNLKQGQVLKGKIVKYEHTSDKELSEPKFEEYQIPQLENYQSFIEYEENGVVKNKAAKTVSAETIDWNNPELNGNNLYKEVVKIVYKPIGLDKDIAQAKSEYEAAKTKANELLLSLNGANKAYSNDRAVESAAQTLKIAIINDDKAVSLADIRLCVADVKNKTDVLNNAVMAAKSNAPLAQAKSEYEAAKTKANELLLSLNGANKAYSNDRAVESAAQTLKIAIINDDKAVSLADIRLCVADVKNKTNVLNNAVMAAKSNAPLAQAKSEYEAAKTKANELLLSLNGANKAYSNDRAVESAAQTLKIAIINDDKAVSLADIRLCVTDVKNKTDVLNNAVMAAKSNAPLAQAKSEYEAAKTKANELLLSLNGANKAYSNDRAVESAAQTLKIAIINDDKAVSLADIRLCVTDVKNKTDVLNNAVMAAKSNAPLAQAKSEYEAAKTKANELLLSLNGANKAYSNDRAVESAAQTLKIAIINDDKAVSLADIRLCVTDVKNKTDVLNNAVMAAKSNAPLAQAKSEYEAAKTKANELLLSLNGANKAYSNDRAVESAAQTLKIAIINDDKAVSLADIRLCVTDVKNKTDVLNNAVMAAKSNAPLAQAKSEYEAAKTKANELLLSLNGANKAYSNDRAVESAAQTLKIAIINDDKAVSLADIRLCVTDVKNKTDVLNNAVMAAKSNAPLAQAKSEYEAAKTKANELLLSLNGANKAYSNDRAVESAAQTLKIAIINDDKAVSLADIRLCVADVKNKTNILNNKINQLKL